MVRDPAGHWKKPRKCLSFTAFLAGAFTFFLTTSPRALSQIPAASNVAGSPLTWCRCLGIECGVDSSKINKAASGRLAGNWDQLRQAVQATPRRFLPNDSQRSIAQVVEQCLQTPAQGETPTSWYLNLRHSEIRTIENTRINYRNMAISMFPIDRIIMVSREVASSPQGRLPRHPGARVVQGCRGELILHLRDDLALREVRQILTAVPLLSHVRFENPLLRQRRASVPSLAEPNAAAAAILFDPNDVRSRVSSTANHAPVVMRSSAIQAGLWNFTSTGWQAVDERGARNSLPLRFLPATCTDPIEHPLQRNASAIPDQSAAITSLGDYQSYLTQLNSLIERETTCMENQADNSVENEPNDQGGCRETPQIRTLISDLRLRVSYQNAMEYEDRIAADASLTMGRRLTARWRQRVYRSRWNLQSETTIDQTNSVILETLRHCARIGYCECKKENFISLLAIANVATGCIYNNSDPLGAQYFVSPRFSAEQRQEYGRLLVQIRQSRVDLANRNHFNLETDAGDYYLEEICTDNRRDGTIEYFQRPFQ